MNVSPLTPILTERGAIFGNYSGWSLPRRFVKISQEYEALRRGVSLIDRSHLGRLKLTGNDALDLLNRMSTNTLADLQPEQWRDTVLTTGKGRVVDVVTVISLPEYLVLLTSPGQEERVAEWLDMYTFLEDCTLESMNQAVSILSLLGPAAQQLLEEFLPKHMRPPDVGEVASLDLGGITVTALRTNPMGVPGYDLLVHSYQATDLWNVLSGLGGQIVVPVGLQALEVRRIENGIGRYGDEYSDAVNPLEVGLRPLISFDKGCYIGQEVIARLNTYDKVQRKLVGFVLDTKKRLSKRQHPKVLVENREVGELTSWVRPPRGKRWLALGYVRRTAWKVGTQVDIVADEGTFPARVASLPFRR
jgi:hypothetical protein